MGARTWSGYNNGNTTQPVATKLANAYGLYDMTGNVYQWCNDWYGSYTAGAATDPTGAPTGTERVLRGFAWVNDSYGYVSGDIVYQFRSAYRDPFDPGSWGDYFLVGFRVVLPR
jgi:formylglycine-generating enzyme required for sulfatase activity